MSGRVGVTRIIRILLSPIGWWMDRAYGREMKRMGLDDD